MPKICAVKHAQRHIGLVLTAALVGITAGTAASAEAAVDSQYDAAIAAARAGRYAEALPIIEDRYRRNPRNLAIAYDYLTVLGWAHRQSDAIAAFEKLPQQGPLPAFVEQAAARDYRDLGRFDEALALYRRGQREYPGRMIFIAGEILTTADSGHAEDALSRSKSLLPAHPHSLELLSAAVYAASKVGDAADTVDFARRVLALDPADREARRELILASDQLGDIENAWLLARLSPDLFSADETRRLSGDWTALLVRQAGATGLGDDERYRRADRAIDALDAQIGELLKAGPDAEAALRRAKFDRVLALSDRDRFEDAIAAYEAFERDGIPVPAYVLKVVGDAYMRLRRPEAAEAVYKRALADSPADFQSNLGLFYAEIESKDFDAALATIDGLADREQRTLGTRPNPDWLRAQIAAAMARVYLGDTDEAQERIEALLAQDPDNPVLLDTFGTILQDRGEPVAAERRFAQADSLRPGDHDAAVGRANTAIDRGDRAAGYAATDKLVDSQIAQDLAPDHATALLRRREETLERPELKFSANQLYQAQRAPLGGDTFNLETQLFSTPIEDAYRLCRLSVGDRLVARGARLGSSHGGRTRIHRQRFRRQR
jgi:biofilm PGA synthesis protein PgaA